MHPCQELLTWLPQFDFAVFSHGFAPHGRDYFIHIQDCLGADPGEHLLEFTHVVQLDYETRVGDEGWKSSWNDVFLTYDGWTAAGEPEGYIWGANWSNAWPGLTIVEPSSIANEWSRRLAKDFFEVALETDRFLLRIVFHSIRHRKLSNETRTIAAVIIPLPGPASETKA